MCFPVKPFTVQEVKIIVKKEVNPKKKAPGYDLITGKILKELSTKCFKFITFIFNAVLRLNYFPVQWN